MYNIFMMYIHLWFIYFRIYIFKLHCFYVCLLNHKLCYFYIKKC